ncbi:unnamed protein product [Heligmosomoides polygyrus]|uniref:Epidermal growth factor receptor substrate 15-like 1 n=1 Tax=Heligmosomoides polygyrus TaxID=6339 RepID=A0A3P8C644_HELPZ|nr:unnamed protein product [Heligmosomoides polygyrus]
MAVKANPSNSLAVPAGEAAAFLKRSNLNLQQLGQIWEVSDYLKKGALDKKGFFIAFKLVAAAQQGYPVSPASIGLPNLHPPHFEGVFDKGAASAAQPLSHDGSMPQQPPTEWGINAVDQLRLGICTTKCEKVNFQVKYDSIFESLCPVDGKLAGAKVRPVLLNSGLNPTILAKIWELADQDKDGQLDRVEMAVAMHLVYRALQNEPVPPVLPNSLIHPSKAHLSRRTSVSSVASGMAGTLSFQPMHSQFAPGQASYRSRTGSMTSLDGIGHPPARPPPVENRSASVQPNQALRNESAPGTPIRGAPLSMSVTSSSNSSLEWPIDRLASAAQFAACDTDSDGFVNGNDVKHVLLGSGLPQTELAHVWALCDVNRTGRLNQEQFALIVHLVNMRKRGEELPSTLPQFLIPPSLRVLPVSVELRTLEVTVKQLERQKMEAGRRLADLDEQIRQLESAALAQAKKAEEAQTRLNQLVEDSQKDAAHAESDQQEIAQLKAELAQLEVERLNLSSQLTREQKSMESAVERKRQRDEAQRAQLHDAIAHAETVVNDLQTVLKSEDPSSALSAKLNLLQDIARKDLFNDVPFSIASTSSQAHSVHQPPDPFAGVQSNMQHVDPFAQTDPFAAAAATGTFAVQFPQDPFGNIAAGGAASSNAVGSTSPGTAAKNPPPRPAPPKSTSARQTPVNGDPFANT